MSDLFIEHEQIAQLQEQISVLEDALAGPGWRAISRESDQEFSRQGLRDLTELCRLSYVKNPLIKRGVSVKKNYVWGSGWAVHAQDPEIQAAIDGFLYDQKNDDVIGSYEARSQLEVELETDGNLFFCFFINATTGFLRVRLITFDQIEDIVANPDDAKEPWYYLRRWTQSGVDPLTGAVTHTTAAAYYPDWRYLPTAPPQSIGGIPVYWDKPIYHVRVGGFTNWKFGLSELYDAIDWSRSYKAFLEDWASIVRAYRKFAFQLTTPSQKAVAPAAKAFGNVRGANGTEHTSPYPNGQSGAGGQSAPPPTGSTFVSSEGYNLQAVKTSGATVAAEDGRRILLMVAASTGLPETFFGDASVGTLATAQSLDRPTELMMLDRQQLWRDVYLNIFGFVQLWAIKAPKGPLSGLGAVMPVEEGGQITELIQWHEGVNDDVAVIYPPLVQKDIPAMVEATVKAATLGAPGQLAGTIDLPTISRLLLNQLGIPDVDEIIERLFPDGLQPAEEQQGPRPVAEAILSKAIQELRLNLLDLRENFS